MMDRKDTRFYSLKHPPPASVKPQSDLEKIDEDEDKEEVKL